MRLRLLRSCLILAASTLAMSVPLHAQAPAADDTLATQFRDPPESARPRVWWHWLSGNIAKEGIHADLEWMKSVGLAGVQMFDGDMGAPQIVPTASRRSAPNGSTTCITPPARPTDWVWNSPWPQRPDGARPEAHGSRRIGHEKAGVE
jgi:hypothetical protein